MLHVKENVANLFFQNTIGKTGGHYFSCTIICYKVALLISFMNNGIWTQDLLFWYNVKSPIHPKSLSWWETVQQYFYISTQSIVDQVIVYKHQYFKLMNSGSTVLYIFQHYLTCHEQRLSSDVKNLSNLPLWMYSILESALCLVWLESKHEMECNGWNGPTK